jgi:hypothetical protein
MGIHKPNEMNGKSLIKWKNLFIYLLLHL